MMHGLWLVRHGALPPNPERRFVGARNVPLSDAGRAQIRALAREFMPALATGQEGKAAEESSEKQAHGLAAVICSDLGRCRETAALLLAGAKWPAGPPPLHADAGLREINLGEWQGLTPEEVRREYPGQYERRGVDIARFCPPGGESFAQVQERALAALARWRARYPRGVLLLVAHAGLNRALLAAYLALPLADALRIPQGYACRAFLPKW